MVRKLGRIRASTYAYSVRRTHVYIRRRSNVSISSSIRCNPRWNQKDQNETDGFNKALTIVGDEFQDRIEFYRLDLTVLSARPLSVGPILCLDAMCNNWSSTGIVNLVLSRNFGLWLSSSPTASFS